MPAIRLTRNLVDLIAIPALLLLVLAVVTTGGSTSVVDASIRGMVMVGAVIGLYTFMGNSGVLSFGHVAFAAIGAYAGSLFSMPPAQKMLLAQGLPEFIKTAEVAPALAPFIGALAATVFALLIAGPIVRLSGLAAGLATFSILVIVSTVISNWSEVTRGTQGLTGVPSAIEEPLAALPWVVGILVIGGIFQVSKSGRRLRASRSDVVASRSIGVKVERERFKALVISAAVMGAVGALYAQTLGTFGPSSFYLTLTFLLISMLIIGGINSLMGAVLGGVVVVVLTEILIEAEGGVTIGPLSISGVENLSQIGLALAILLILMFRPQGIMRGNEMRVSSVINKFRKGGTAT